VSKEARDVGLAIYKLEFGTLSKWRGWKRVLVSPPRIWVNWDVDTVRERGRGEDGKTDGGDGPLRSLEGPNGERAERVEGSPFYLG